MAVKTKAQLLAEVASLLADNTTGDISALDVRTCLNDIIDSASYGGKKVYKALLTQSGTSAPVATVLENTLSGTLVWTRASAGNYSGTLTGEFVHNKTYVYGMIDYYDQGQALIPISDGAAIIGYYSVFITDPNSIDVEVFNATFTNVDLSTLLGTSSICLPPIEVYP